ncbi:hypothetical protein PINS_up020251 [Pythium insidiosum]|nr:hypothetical protein PINS_up020251 [Pythium insidiosum]
MRGLRIGLCLRILALVLLLALVPTGYLVYELQLKPWGRDQLKAAAASAANAVPSLVNTNADAPACTQCPGINAVFPVTVTTHPTYSGFQKTLINDGGWIASLTVALGVGLGGGGSLLLALFSTANGAATTTTTAAVQPKPTSSTAFNGCGIFEMVMLLSHAQFATMLGMLRLHGAPRFWDEFAKKLAWSNLFIFPPETHLKYETAAANARRLDAHDGSIATGVDRYALLVGVEPQHLFYFTCTGECRDAELLKTRGSTVLTPCCDGTNSSSDRIGDHPVGVSHASTRPYGMPSTFRWDARSPCDLGLPSTLSFGAIRCLADSVLPNLPSSKQIEASPPATSHSPSFCWRCCALECSSLELSSCRDIEKS